jgi:hypothetical protein
VKPEQITELLYQALETEKGGVNIYETALKCAVNPDLKREGGISRADSESRTDHARSDGEARDRSGEGYTWP